MVRPRLFQQLYIAAACFIAAGLTPLLAHASEPVPALAPCHFEAPADLDASPTRWLGDCPQGMAEGLGVLRGRTGEPYAFFAGVMRRGRPDQGLLMLRQGGWMVAVAFDERLKVVQNGGFHPEWDDLAFEQAHAGALAAAGWFRRQGNQTSAAYYTRMARGIIDGRPE